jgi:hypothetical protein
LEMGSRELLAVFFLISASQVARITGVSHWCLTEFYFKSARMSIKHDN